MNSRDRKRLKREHPTYEACETCEAKATTGIEWYKRMRLEMNDLEKKLNQERQSNRQLRSTLKSITK